jgi:hypothetical protein
VARHEMIAGDTLPDFVVQLLGSDGLPADLTSADDLTFVMAPADDLTTAKVRDSTHATITTPGSGVVTYNFQAQDVDTVGTFLAQWVVHYPGGAHQTYPVRGYDVVVLREAL